MSETGISSKPLTDDDRVERVLIDRARQHHSSESVAAAVLWLKNRRPDIAHSVVATTNDRGLANGIWIGAIGSLIVIALILALAWYLT